MGSIVIGSIIDRARNTLLETGPSDVRWNRTGELLNHANAAQRAIVAAKPDAFVKNVAFTLASGAKQSLPVDGVQFFNAEHNLGADGLTPGGAILIADRHNLTRAERYWMSMVGAEVEHFLHDQRDPKTFYVYPRPAGVWQVNLLYSAVPPIIAVGNIDANPAGLIAVDDLYDTPIHDYIVGYALMKNFKAGEQNKATYFLTKFANSLGLRVQTQFSFAPLDAEASEMAPDAPGKP